MKRISRNPEKVEVLKLFKGLAYKHNLKLSNEIDMNRFFQIIAESFGEIKDSKTTLFGHRTESMFGYVAASLGKCCMIKEEDSGELYTLDTEIQIPDFRIVLDDGYEFFVEVKNCHKQGISSHFSITEIYICKLKKYADIFKKDIKIAIYWSQWNIWTLIPMDKIHFKKGKYAISLPEAKKIDEMHLLGDLLVGTLPPLVFRVITDSSKPRAIDKSGNVNFTIGNIELYCGKTKIEDKSEQEIALYFMLFGDWITKKEYKIESKELIAIDIRLEPEEPVERQECQIVGSLSEMISRRFKSLTSADGTLSRLIPSLEPGTLCVVIPPNYKGRNLPLWRFKVQPN